MSGDVIDDVGPVRSAQRAEYLADDAARASGVVVRILHDERDHHEASAVLHRIWGQTDGAPLTPETLHAFAYTDNYVGAAFDGDAMVAVASAFRTGHGTLHSHIAGVLPSHQGRSVGYVLKLHQRAWALAHGITSVSWTFDPLIRRNAHFNLVKLGARIADYLPDFYGAMADAINAGDHSDRLLADWDLLAAEPGAAVLTADGAATVLRVGGRGEPVTADPGVGPRRLELPADLESLRRNDPALAREWRAAFRSALGAAWATGHRIVGMDHHSAYVTRKDNP